MLQEHPTRAGTNIKMVAAAGQKRSVGHSTGMTRRRCLMQRVGRCASRTSIPTELLILVNARIVRSLSMDLLTVVAHAEGRTTGQVPVIATQASPIPRPCPCPSSEGRPPRWLTGSAFGAASSCSTSVAVRCELSRLRLWESLLPSFV
jgi:hypothetical protein